jgi:hypothetical protein
MTALARLLVITGALAWACIIFACWLVFHEWFTLARKRRRRLRTLAQDRADDARTIFPAEWLDDAKARRH